MGAAGEETELGSVDALFLEDDAERRRAFGLPEDAWELLKLEALRGTPEWPDFVGTTDRAIGKHLGMDVAQVRRTRSLRKFQEARRVLVLEDVTDPLKLAQLAQTAFKLATEDQSETALNTYWRMVQQIQPQAQESRALDDLDDMDIEEVIELLEGYVELRGEGWKVKVVKPRRRRD